MRTPVLNRAQNRTESGLKLPAAMRTPVLNRAQNRTESGPKLPAAMQTPVLNRANTRTKGVRPCSHVRAEPGAEPDGERAEAASRNVNPGS